MKYTVTFNADITMILDEEGLAKIARKKDGVISQKKLKEFLDVDQLIVENAKIFASDK